MSETTTPLQELLDKRAAVWEKMQEILGRSETDSRAMSGEEIDSYERAETELDGYTREIDVREKNADLDERFAKVDDAKVRVGEPGDDAPAERAERGYGDAFVAYMRHGMGSLTPEQRQSLQSGFVAATELRAQSVGTDSAGGYTVPQGFWAKVTESMLAFAQVTDIAEVIDTESGNALPWPTNDDTGNSGSLLAENTAASETDLVFGQKQLDAYMFTSDLVRVSIQLLQDSGIDIEGFLARKLGQRIGRAINTYFTTGTGTAQPQGYVTGATVGKTAAAVAAITYDELVDLVHSVDVAYRTNDPSWALHDLSLAAVRKLKDSNNLPLWQPTIAAGVPDTILGYRYFVNNDMAQMATGNKTFAFGSFADAFVIRRVAGGQMLRLAERYAEYLQVGFIGFARYDSVTQDASAVKVLQQA